MVTGPGKCSIQPRDENRSNAKEDGNMAEHKHGEMDITAQEKTFEGFVRAATWGASLCVVALVLLAIINV